MPAAQTLTTNIVINATAGNSLTTLGNTFTVLGSMVNGLSQQIIDIGKRSINVYRDYEQSMQDARASLAKQYGWDSAELSQVMDDLDAHAKKWASSTIFHTNDVANAIAQAAHAGYDYNEIVGQMPAAMRLAQAGGIDLSTALDMLVKSSLSLGLPIEKTDEFVDHWIYAANSSATNVEEVGEAMLRMGSTMRWAADPDEVLTMIAALANVGTVGSKAGTLLRNTLLRLIVPATSKAELAIDQLGKSYLDGLRVLDGYFGDEDTSFYERAAAAMEEKAEREGLVLTTAQKTALMDAENRDAWYNVLKSNNDLGALWREFLLEQLRNDEIMSEVQMSQEERSKATFRVYDEAGKLRPMLKIYDDLNVALGGVAGTFEELEKNGSVMDVMGRIFTARTIQGGLGLLAGAARGWDTLYESMRGGKAEGYGQYAANTMMDSLYGSLEIFKSRVENLELVIGEHLKPDVQAVSEFFGQIANSMAEMDPATLDALIRAAEVVGVAGPGLLLAGTAFRLIGTALGSTAGAVALATLAITAGAAAWQEYNNAVYEGNFGDMKLDTLELEQYIRSIGTDFERAYTNANEFSKSLEGAVEQYTAASSSLSGKLFNALVMGTTLSEAEIAQLMSLGDQMYNSLIEGINTSAARTLSFWEAFFGGEGVAEGSEAFQEITGVTNDATAAAILNAQQIGADLRKAMTAAFEDGELSEDEYEKILSYINDYNRAMAEAAAQAQSEEDYINMQVRLHKAQTASYDELVELTDEVLAEREETMQGASDRFWYEYFKAQLNGTSQETLDEAETRFENEQRGLEKRYDDFLTQMWQSQISQSDQQEGYGILRGVARQFLSGSLTEAEAQSQLAEALGNNAYMGQLDMGNSSARSQLGRMLGSWLYYMGGSGAVSEQIKYAQKSGDTEWAESLSLMLAMAGLVNDFNPGTVEKGLFGTSFGAGFKTDTISNESLFFRGLNRDAILEGLGLTGGISPARRIAGSIGSYSENAAGVNELETFFEGIFAQYQAGTLGDALAAAQADNAALFEQIGSVLTDMRNNYDLQQVFADLGINGSKLDQTSRDLVAVWALLYGRESDPTVQQRLGIKNYLLTEEPEEIPVAPKQSGENSLESLQKTISGLSLRTGVRYSGALGSLTRFFAAGGRADSASVFGEAGPEWAIPESHSERTAALLNAARAASGFTWADLLARYGGLNTSEGSGTTLIYSPTVQAKNTEGVAEALRQDGRELERLLEERRQLQAAVRYA